LPESEQDEAAADRAQALADHAAELKALSHSRWKQRVSLGLGKAGAAWQVAEGDMLGGLLAFGAGATGAAAARRQIKANPYSYLFIARNRFA
jgi:hypothetical protein